VRRYGDGEVILYYPDGSPYWTYRFRRPYQRNMIGFRPPKELGNEPLDRDGDERSPVVPEALEAGKEKRAGEGS